MIDDIITMLLNLLPAIETAESLLVTPVRNLISSLYGINPTPAQLLSLQNAENILDAKFTADAVAAGAAPPPAS